LGGGDNSLRSKFKIIAGKYKGKLLELQNNSDIRPTQNYIKEAIFNVIQFNIKGAGFLDLYAGTGAIGIEAISRKAAFVDFIEAESNTIPLLKQNLRIIDNDFDYNVFKYRITTKSLCLVKFRSYDFIFLDPPYRSGYIKKGLEFINRCNLLTKDGVIIAESLEYESYDISSFECYKDIKYSKKIVRFLKKR